MTFSPLGNQYQVQPPESRPDAYHGARRRHPDRQEIKVATEWPKGGLDKGTVLDLKRKWKNNLTVQYIIISTEHPLKSK